MKTTVNGKDIIRHAEGLRLEAYLCQANVPTIGYGHTQGVKLGDRCTRVQAEVRRREDIAASEKSINNLGL